MSNQTNDNHYEIIETLFWDWVSGRDRLLDYINKWELYDFLNKEKKELLDAIAVPIQIYKDSMKGKYNE